MALTGRVALVTGGTRGIGLAIAKAYVEAGATVYISGRDADVGEKAARDLGSSCYFIACDVMSGQSIERMFTHIQDAKGRLDILVNNAGGALGFSTVAEMSDELWDQMMTLNLTSAFKTSRAAMRIMLKQQYGRIINISSVEGKQGRPGFGHYAATKHGLIGLTKCLSKEGGLHGITANAICPGLVITDLIRNQAGAAAQAAGMELEPFLDTYAQQAAIGRPILLEEVSALALLLASEAGGGISGAPISVDGGTATY
jgi:NAD(P)-dependent dehydrogenase (short-subunit alcohol dehydrogenase family)